MRRRGTVCMDRIDHTQPMDRIDHTQPMDRIDHTQLKLLPLSCHSYIFTVQSINQSINQSNRPPTQPISLLVCRYKEVNSRLRKLLVEERRSLQQVTSCRVPYISYCSAPSSCFAFFCKHTAYEVMFLTIHATINVDLSLMIDDQCIHASPSICLSSSLC